MARSVYTVRQVNQYVKNMFEQDYLLRRLSVKGEVSNCKYHSSGHIYFSLKDESGTLACVMFAGQRKGLSFYMKDGDQVVVTGSVTVYPRDGRYQLYAAMIELAGAGALYERFLRLKNELEEMGMFDQTYKKPVPAFVSRVGIVTASTGAAIRDIENISGRRNPYVQLILYPAKVQGEGASASIVRGIRTLDRMGVDVIIVGRGGGSIEDLWAFNEEIVARAIFECETPVISAVGHETDVTISDFAADLRAPTPSAAAELAVYEIGAYDASLLEKKQKMQRALRSRILAEKERLARLDRRFLAQSPKSVLREKREDLVRISDKMERSMRDILKHNSEHTQELQQSMKRSMENRLLAAKHRNDLLTSRLSGLSPSGKLGRGYAFIEGEDGKAVQSALLLKRGDALTVHFADGRAETEVRDIIPEKNGL